VIKRKIFIRVADEKLANPGPPWLQYWPSLSGSFGSLECLCR